MRPRLYLVLLAFGLVLSLATPAGATIQVSISDLSLPSGSTQGTIDVSITSNGPDPLQAFQMELKITPLPGASVTLGFASSQPNISGESNYVFAGNSFSYNTSFPNSPATDTILVGDSTADFSDVTVDNTSSKLLARLAVESVGTPLATSSFQVSLAPLSGDSNDFLSGNSHTGFLSFDGSNFNPIAFTSTSGTVTLAGTAAAVPEPATAVLLGSAAVTLLGYGWRRRKGRG